MSVPANLNQTEHAAYEWLVSEKGYSQSDIQRERADQSPDFICPDESYEAKRPSTRGKFILSERQQEQFDTFDPIIVIIHEDDDSPRETFRWSERSSAGWTAHSYDQSQIRMQVSSKDKRRWNSLLARIDEDESVALSHLLDYFESDASRVEEARRAGSRETEFRGPG